MTVSTRTDTKLEDLLNGTEEEALPEYRISNQAENFALPLHLLVWKSSFPTASYGGYKTSTLSPRDKATGIVRNFPEAMVKVDKASKGIKSVSHLMTAAYYISRDGKINLEDENGCSLLKAELKDRMTEWGKSQDMPEMEIEGMKRSADARRLIFLVLKGVILKQSKLQ